MLDQPYTEYDFEDSLSGFGPGDSVESAYGFHKNKLARIKEENKCFFKSDFDKINQDINNNLIVKDILVGHTAQYDDEMCIYNIIHMDCLLNLLTANGHIISANASFFEPVTETGV